MMQTSQSRSPSSGVRGVGIPICCHQKETPPLCTRSLSLGVCPPTGGGGTLEFAAGNYGAGGIIDIGPI